MKPMGFIIVVANFRPFILCNVLRKAGGTLCQTLQLQMRNESQRKATMQVVIGDTPRHGQFRQNYRMNKSMFIFLIPLAAAGEHLRTHFACLARLCRFACG